MIHIFLLMFGSSLFVGFKIATAPECCVKHLVGHLILYFLIYIVAFIQVVLWTIPIADVILPFNYVLAFLTVSGIWGGFFIGHLLFRKQRKQRNEIRDWFRERFGEPLQKL